MRHRGRRRCHSWTGANPDAGERFCDARTLLRGKGPKTISEQGSQLQQVEVRVSHSIDTHKMPKAYVVVDS
jgi:hypothetical protein